MTGKVLGKIRVIFMDVGNGIIPLPTFFMFLDIIISVKDEISILYDIREIY